MGSIHGTNAAEEHGIRRSPHWPTVEKHFLASNPRCLACTPDEEAARRAQVPGFPTRGLQVHHAVMPFHFCILLGRPELELDPRNLVVFCEDEAGVKTQDHHVACGHLLDFQSYAPDAASVANQFMGKSKTQLLSSAEFMAMCHARPKAWRDLTDDEKKAMRQMLDAKLPKI